MRSSKNFLSAIAGMAMLALPASALAGHHHEWNGGPRPFAWHDQGEHRGWFKHHGYVAQPAWAEDEDEGEHWRSHRERTPAFLRDEDEDDCESAGPDYWGGYDYGPPISYYQAAPPIGYGRAQRRAWLLRRRARAYYLMQVMRARHDNRGARRMSGVITSLDSSLARGNRFAGRGYPVPSGPYYNTAYNGNYGYAPNYQPDAYGPNYQPNPGMNILTNMVAPLIGMPNY